MILNSNRLIKITDGKNIRISTLKDYVEIETIRRKESQSVVKEQQELLKTEQELLKTEDAAPESPGGPTAPADQKYKAELYCRGGNEKNNRRDLGGRHAQYSNSG